MNRLILVGNGFDLAHGLKTSYKDFIIWYLANCFYKADPYRFTYEDDLISINTYNINYFKDYVRENITPSSKFLLQEEEIQQLLNIFYERGELCNFLGIYEDDISNLIFVSSNDTYMSSHDHNEPVKVKFLSSFFRNLIVICQDCNWVDIENEYFDQLKACKSKDGTFDKKEVCKLNSEFTFLKQKLEKYLILQQEQADIKVIPELLEAIKSDFEISDFDSIIPYEDVRNKLGFDRTITPQIQHNLYFLNFNYTNTLSKYEEEFKNSRGKFNRIEINYIHGELNRLENPIIFGFGDEYDKQYAEFEEHRNNQLFEHIKSYQYLRTPHYRNLLRFLNTADYQVFVMGHSCGLSDRTMFKEIFEHENCKSIRLFHYKGDFHDKAINVSKHFSNKGYMRKLIVDYKASDAFPQL